LTGSAGCGPTPKRTDNSGMDRVIEVSGPAYVSVEHRQLMVEREGRLVGTAPLAEIAVILLDGPEIVATVDGLRAALAEGVAVVIGDDKHLPSGLALNLDRNALHTAILRQQTECSLPKRKRVWQQIVQAKIDAQGQLLRNLGQPWQDLAEMKTRLQSGDPMNLEAQAAALYFERLFGETFLRDREEPGVNAMLNYGYAVLRAMVARALVGTGLHPALGVHHRNQYNPYCLADDAMEPLRPLVDALVYRQWRQTPDVTELTPPIKRALIKVSVCDVNFAGNSTPIAYALGRYATSLRRAICEGNRRILVPTPWRSVDTESCGSW
jgi:CRISPR-associated protein Cas1